MTATKHKPIATVRFGLFSKLKLYHDHIESTGMLGPGGEIKGAEARVETRGWRDQKVTLSIVGPRISFSHELPKGGSYRRQADSFAAKVNSAAQRLEA